MDLSIRSQDRKRLIKYGKLITVEFTDKTECEIWDNTVKLGAYKTEERALEVLDEIQSKIAILNYQRHYLNKEFNVIESNVYQMPID